MWWYDDFGWVGWILTGLITVAALLVLVVVGLTVLRAVDRRAQQGAGTTSARTSEQLLDDRFARGEIDEHEYQRRRDLLRSSR